LKPRVLILLENEPYPHDTRVCQEALALIEAGYEVTVVSPNAALVPELETCVDGVRVLRYPAPPAGGSAVGYVREYLLALVRMRRVLRRLRTERFSAVIACNPPDFLIQLARPFARHGAGLVFDLHDLSPELFESKFQRRGLIYRVLVALERWAERTADVVMTVNEPCAELVRGRGGIPAERVFVLVTCPSPGRFFPVEPRPELRRGKEHLVLWIGRMSRKENLSVLLDAADELVNRHGRSDIGFAIVGRGEVREELEAEAERRGLASSVFLPGLADDQLVRQWLATADVCVSLDEHGPMNDSSLMVKVLEYMAMGKPIVQFPLREMRRVCDDASVYAANGDARDLAEKVGELIDDPARRERLGDAARKRMNDLGLIWSEQVPTLLAAVERATALRNGRPTSAPEKEPAPVRLP
jgi:glycosyltransferase involved in cell wall biosynthesis